MLKCKACLQRCLAAVLRVERRQGLRTHAPSAIQEVDGGSNVVRPRRAYGIAPGAQPRPPRVTRPDEATDEEASAAAEGGRDPGRIVRRQVGLELKYIKDPLRLANRVLVALRNGDEDKAFELVRAASKSIQCTVGWNHVINHLMGVGRVKDALKAYNDMKKRQQIPDAHTFTLLLRGLATHAHHQTALAKALTIYHSMQAPKSPVKPSIIHTNAVLKVCARAKDMDSLWSIASKLPARGPSTPDSWTWTTIVNAIRQEVEDPPGSGSGSGSGSDSEQNSDESSSLKQKAVVQVRHIWGDIVGRWRRSELQVDETLVCAVGRLLLISQRPKDWHAVFSLIEMTMEIPRLASPLDSRSEAVARRGADTSRAAAAAADAVDTVASAVEPTTDTKDETVMKELDQLDDVFEVRRGSAALKLSSGGGRDKKSIVALARPGTNTLSLILETCMKLRDKKAASAYWELLTERYSHSVEPDEANYNAFLRLLRLTRSSAETVELLEQLTEQSRASQDDRRKQWLQQQRGREQEQQAPTKKARPGPKMFWIAMTTCARDRLNPHVFSHATRVLQMMRTAMADANLGTMDKYLDIAVEIDARYRRTGYAGPSDDQSTAASGDVAVVADRQAVKQPEKVLAQALENLTPCMLNLKSKLAYGRYRDGARVTPDTRQDIVQLARRMAGSYGHLMDRGGRGRAKNWALYRLRTKELFALVERYKVGGGDVSVDGDGGGSGDGNAEGSKESE